MIDIKKLVKEYLGLGNYIEVPFSKKLTGGKAINISKYSGLVSVIKRRSSKTIAETWSKKIYGKNLSGGKYTSQAPAMISRQTYVLETILSKINLKSKSLVDVGAGEGTFLNMFKKKKISLRLFGIEPSKKNCTKIKKYKIKYFNGIIEEYNPKKIEKKFDIATLTWTLCNCSNAYKVIESTHRILKKNGYIVVAEGSRIMVPFKKPIQMYIENKNSPDTKPFHFSKNSLINLLILNKFRPVFVNRYLDNDNLLVIAKKIDKIEAHKIKLENYKKVKNFFIEWYKHSKKYKK